MHPPKMMWSDLLCTTGTKRHNSRCPGLFMHDPANELRRIPLLRLSEKGRKSLQCSLTEHRNGSFRPILACLHFPNPRSEYRSYPFSDSLGRGILRSSLAESCLERSSRGERMPSEAIPAAWQGSTCCGGE